MHWFSLFLITFLLSAPAGAQATAERLLRVTGTGSFAAMPDMATVRLGVVTDARLAADAIRENSAGMEEVMATLRDLGIAERDVQTTDFSVNPRWNRTNDNIRPEIIGYSVRNMVVVRVRALDGLGSVLDALAGEGANTFEGLQFDLSDPQEAEDTARRSAISDARRKAALFAEAAGVTLGDIVSIFEGAGGVPPRPMARAAFEMAADAVPVAPGEVDLRAQVTLVYEISNTEP